MWLLSVLHIVLLCVASYCEASNTSVTSFSGNTTLGASGFKVELNHLGLVASVTYGLPLLHYGNDPNLIWDLLAQKIAKDVNQPPFSTTGSVPRYDIWPLLTLGPGGAEAIPPSYLIRFSLMPVPGTCWRKVIDRGFLRSFGKVFQEMADQTPRPGYSFAGTVDRSGDALYQFQLISTGAKIAKSERKQDYIEPENMIALNRGRNTILSQTTPDDLLLFIGCTGAYFYHTLNRPGDLPPMRRNAWLVPVSGAGSWSERRHLDVLDKHPVEYGHFKSTVLAPPLASKSRSRKSRVIVIDYARTGTTVIDLQGILRESRIWNGPLYFINVMSMEDPHGQPHIWSVKTLKPIDVGDDHQRRILTEGGLGRVVPPYPWFYWDVDWQQVDYPEKSRAQDLIDAIHEAGSMASNTLPSSANTTIIGNGTSIGNSSSIVPANTNATTTTIDSPTLSNDTASDYVIPMPPPWPIAKPQLCVANESTSALNSPYSQNVTSNTNLPAAVGSVQTS